MPIEGFDFQVFAKELAEQVGPALPNDLEEGDKKYIVNIVHNFCYMAGEHLANDTSISINNEQAATITQFIGEWAFHKAIDFTRSGIDPQFRDGVLQKVAFTVFEIAKTATIKGMGQADIISVVEFHVKKAYTEALQELKNRYIINDQQLEYALSQSNIDKMAHETAEAEMNAEQGAQSQNDYANQVSDIKILKLATFAIVLKKLPADKRQKMLERFSPDDAAILADYARMDDLEYKLDPNVIAKGLQEIKASLPKSKVVNSSRINQKIYNIVKNSDISKISNIIRKERQAVRDYVNNASSGNKNTTISPRVADIICSHLEEKLYR